MTKGDLRKHAKSQRMSVVAGMTHAECCAAAVLLAARVDAELGDARIVATYLPIGSEIDTLPLIERLEIRGVTIVLPHVTGPRGAMCFLRWAPGDPLPAGPLGLRQPAADADELEPDLVLTPLLAFDRSLNRLGYGAGHYDRAFARLPAARRVGLAWASQFVETLPTDAWDVPLHAVATQQEWIAR